MGPPCRFFRLADRQVVEEIPLTFDFRGATSRRASLCKEMGAFFVLNSARQGAPDKTNQSAGMKAGSLFGGTQAADHEENIR